MELQSGAEAIKRGMSCSAQERRASRGEEQVEIFRKGKLQSTGLLFASAIQIHSHRVQKQVESVPVFDTDESEHDGDGKGGGGGKGQLNDKRERRRENVDDSQLLPGREAGAAY